MIDDDDSPKMGEWTVPAGLNRRTDSFTREGTMNEQIQKLIEQATEVDYETFDSYNYRTVTHYIFNKEKFAELLIQQCIVLVLNGKYDTDEFRANDDFHRGFNTALNETAEGLKLYYGIK